MNSPAAPVFEAQARRVSQMYAALSAANEASAQLGDERNLYQRICDIVVQYGGMRLASVRLRRPGTHWLDTCAYAGEAAGYLPDARISLDPSLPEGRGLGGPALRENRTIVCNDFVSEPRLAPWHAGARRFGFASVACVPLRRAGSPVALLALYATATDHFDPELVTLVERMAANVGHALDRLEAERRMRESEARFRSLANLHAASSSANEAILRAASPAELLSRACEIAVASGNFVLGTGFLFDQASGQLMRVAKSGPAAAYPLTESPIYDSLVAAAWQSREVMVSNDYQSDPRTLRRRQHPYPYPHRLGAGAVWPLFVDGEPVGVFSLLHAEKNAFSEEMTLLLQRLADNMSFALANFAHEELRRKAEKELRESIAERIGAEERLQQSLERFEIVARATNDVVWDWNLVTDQLWLNDNFCAVFGYEAGEVGGYIDAWTGRIHPEDAARVKQDIRAAIDRGERVWTAEYRLRRKDGSYANVLDRGMPLRDSAGRPVRMIGAMADISERKRAERKLALHAQRQEIIARLGQFALGGADLEQVLAEAARVLRAARTTNS